MSRICLAKSVAFPVELTTRRSAVFGISGSGKSNTATVCIEQLLAAGEQVVLVDPKGEGWGLQSSADGKRAGFEVIVFGRPRGDIEDLREEHAEQIADFVVDSGRSVVLSLLGFDSDQSERRFVTRFFQRLYRRKSQQPTKTRTLVVLEEAHLFVPEQAAGASAEMVGAIKRIARQGRSAGLGLMLVDQRPQDVAKSIISQCELLICHQLVHKLDRDALREWIRAYDRDGQGEAFLASLAELQPGEAWVWSPAWLQLFLRAKIDRRSTYDSGATPSGSPAAAPKAKTKVDLDSLRTHLAKVVDQAKADDPRELRKRIADLEKQLNKPAPAVQPTEIRVEVPVMKDGQLDKAHALVERWAQLTDRMTATAAELKGAIDRAARPAATTAATQKGGNLPFKTQPPTPPRVAAEPTGDLTAPQQTILDTIAMLRVRGLEPNREMVARWIGIHPRGGSYGENLAALRSQGYLVGFVLSLKGNNAVRHCSTGLDAAMAALDGEPKRNILRALLDGPPMSRDELAEKLGIHPRGGSFGENLAWLRTMGLITERGPIAVTEALIR